MYPFYETEDRTTTAALLGLGDVPEGWRLYPVHGVEGGVCTCPKGKACGSPGKHPATPNGIKDASSDPERIAAMFARAPRNANVGLATGKGSGVVNLDVDSWHGGGQSLKRLQQQHGKLPGTRMHQSGGADVHFFYAFPEGLDRLPSRTLAPGVELKADGAGVVLPSSSHVSSGRYEVLIDGPLAELPSVVVHLATGLSVIEGEGEKTTSRYRLPERIHEGTRNRTLCGYAGSLRAHGWEPPDVLAELRRANDGRCVPPLPDGELRDIARQSARWEKGNASTVAPEVLEALDLIEAMIRERPWPGVGGGSERDVMVALVKAARQHGTLIAAGVRVSLATRPLALAAGMPQPSLMRVLKRLRVERKLIHRDDADRGLTEAGAFVLLHPPSAARANRYRSTTSPTPPAEPTCLVSDNGSRAPFTAARLRWGKRLGKKCGALVDALEGAGGELTLKDAAEALGTKRPRDLTRRRTEEGGRDGYVTRLQKTGVVECDGETVRLRPDWLRALKWERISSGEKRAENDDRAVYEQESDDHRERLAVWIAQKRTSKEEGEQDG